MSLVVDSFVMGPFQSNCYVVRSERGATEAVVISAHDAVPRRLESLGLVVDLPPPDPSAPI